MTAAGGAGERFGIDALAELPPTLPSLSPEEEARTRGLAGAANLGLNEGLAGPLPAARAAIDEALRGLNRYPSRGSGRLTEALAEHLGVEPQSVVVAAGADALIGYVTQAALQAGDEAVLPWPSFPSFLRDTQKRGAHPVTVPLRAWQVDLDAIAAAVTERTRLVFLATPNNPTGVPLAPADLASFVEGLSTKVVCVIDEAYFEYLEPGPDEALDLLRAGHRVLVLRTFSKLYGLAGLRVGYGIGPDDVIDGIRRVQRGYDVNTLAQAAALASLTPEAQAELPARRAANRHAVAALREVVVRHGLEPVAASIANFLLVQVGSDADADVVADGLERDGVYVQRGGPFGAPGTLRIAAGSPEELAQLDRSLARTLAGLGTGRSATLG